MKPLLEVRNLRVSFGDQEVVHGIPVKTSLVAILVAMGLVAMSLAALEKVGNPRAIITHMDNTMDYDDLASELPAGVEPGYDGLEVEV